LLRKKSSNRFLRISTNLNDIEVPTEQKSFTTVLKNLSYLFKGESLFTKKQFAKVVTEEKVETEKKLPSVIEKARYDFEANVEHMMAGAGTDY